MIRVLVTLVVLLMFACASDNGTGPYAGGGGNDFPNSASGLGKRVADNLSEYDQWENNLYTPEALPDISGGIDITIPETPVNTLSKRLSGSASQQDSFTYDLSDTAALGIFRLYVERITDSTRGYDTIVGLWDDAARDDIPSNEHLVSVSGMTVHPAVNYTILYSASDDDGNGVLNSDVPADDRIRVTLKIVYAETGYLALSEIVVDAGADGDFETDGDNRIYYSVSAVLYNQDTLSSYHFYDAEGDSVIIDYGDPDSCLVDVEFFSAGLGLSPLQSRVSTRARYVVFPVDSTRHYPIRLWAKEEQRSGIITVSGIYGMRPDSCFFTGDTVTASVVTLFPADNEFLSDTLKMSILAGQGFSDNSLLSVYRHVTRRLGEERGLIFFFSVAEPLQKGEIPSAGTASLRIEYADGSWIGLNGSFDRESIGASITRSDGASWYAVWDSQGNLASYQVVN